jgi:hypothetical protein
MKGIIVSEPIGRTIQLYLVDGTPNGLVIASIHGWTGAVLVSTQSTFGRLLERSETDRTGVYILYGPDPDDGLQMRAYIGEADTVCDRISDSAGKRGFWETAVVITTSDEALSKGHVRYLEARLIEIAKSARRATLDNVQMPGSERRRLPEADRANMEAFLANLKVILPVVGVDLLKPRPEALVKTMPTAVGEAIVPETGQPSFEVRHKSGVKAFAVEEDGEFVVLEGAEALKDMDFAHNNYANLKRELIQDGILKPTPDGKRYIFTKSYSFRSPSAAGAVILDRNTNGRTRWYVIGSRLNYHEWQSSRPLSSGTATAVDDAVS